MWQLVYGVLLQIACVVPLYLGDLEIQLIPRSQIEDLIMLLPSVAPLPVDTASYTARLTARHRNTTLVSGSRYLMFRWNLRRFLPKNVEHQSAHEADNQRNDAFGECRQTLSRLDYTLHIVDHDKPPFP